MYGVAWVVIRPAKCVRQQGKLNGGNRSLRVNLISISNWVFRFTDSTMVFRRIIGVRQAFFKLLVNKVLCPIIWFDSVGFVLFLLCLD